MVQIGGLTLVSFKLSLIFIVILAIFVSGCVTPTTNFSSEGISFQYPAYWNQASIPTNDQVLANQSGFKILGVILESDNLTNYIFYVGVGKSNNNLEVASLKLYQNFILKNTNSTINTQTMLRNGYPAYVYSYNTQRTSSNRTLVEKTYVFTKDNLTSYYLMFAAPEGYFEEKKMENLVDSVVII
ncbi:MAG TPA: hypothetical protein VK444_06415 [Methanobacteriaceae archaeon]|nr:hypothetical protein [Methanobacteriaceae archaeon]